MKTLAKVEKDKAQALIMVPTWRGQLWANFLNRMSVKKVDLWFAEQILNPGKSKADNPLVKLPPGKLEANLVLSTITEKISQDQWRGLQGFTPVWKVYGRALFEVGRNNGYESRCSFGQYFDVEGCKRGINVKKDLRKIKIHANMDLGIFDNSRNELQSPLAVAVAWNLEHLRSGYAKYPTVRSIGRLFDYIREIGLGEGRVLIQQTMALVVAFSGYRMKEFAIIKTLDIQQLEDRTTIHTRVKRGKKIREFNIKFLNRNEGCCADEDLRQWLMDSYYGQGQKANILRDFTHNRVLGSLGCNSELQKLIMKAGVDDEFGDNSI
ncbi:MAG: hypothetical protein EZS28_042735, partial [Streblomastix strix]